MAEGNATETICEGNKIRLGKWIKQAKAKNLFSANNGEASAYNQIKEACLGDGVLFEDPDFPADETSLYFSGGEEFEWLRPSEITDDPQFFVSGASRFDVKQGELGDCWFLAAVANLTLNKRLFHNVVPENNSFTDDYCGVFHFRFWQYGEWVEVVVDDRLPTRNGRLVYMHSDDSNEYWSALLEKAYAKLHGNYEALKGGRTCEALQDFTGGVSETYKPGETENLFEIMQKALTWRSLMGCSIGADPYQYEAETSIGLVKGHAYSITSVKRIEINDLGEVSLLRIRNPWGNAVEWKGPWSDGSGEWEYIPEDTREELGLTFDSDGEFWMSFDDFTNYFEDLEICNLSADDLDEGDGEEEERKHWINNHYEGSWVPGVTAGGCINYRESFPCNPQYVINLEEPDEDDADQKCTVLVALIQKNRRALRKYGLDCLSIGFMVYALDNPDEHEAPLSQRFFMYNGSVDGGPTFINSREVCARFTLDPGTYVIVPSTFRPNEEAEFLIRVFTETSVKMIEHDVEEVGEGEVDERVKESEEDIEEQKRNAAELFESVAGEDEEVDWEELKNALDLAVTKDDPDFQGFSRDVCRSMVALMDASMTGKLGLEEFVQLWESVRVWKNVFRLYDEDNSGQLSSFELRNALTSTGYHVNNKVLEALVLRYGDKSGQIPFDDFIMCAVKLKQMIEVFREKAGSEKTATFTLDEWVQKTLYS